jgi:hypothetical protein
MDTTTSPSAEGVLRRAGIDTCVRLPLRVDSARLSDQINALSAQSWGLASRGPVVFADVQSVYVVGHPINTGIATTEDRPVLERLPYLREVLREVIPAPVRRALIARQPGDKLVPIHTDTFRHFKDTVRLSFQVDADGPLRFMSNGLWYDFGLGEVWALDNLTPHGLHNSGRKARTTVIADFEPTDRLMDLVARGDTRLGARDEVAQRKLEQLTERHHRKHFVQYVIYGVVKRWRRLSSGY